MCMCVIGVSAVQCGYNSCKVNVFCTTYTTANVCSVCCAWMEFCLYAQKVKKG